MKKLLLILFLIPLLSTGQTINISTATTSVCAGTSLNFTAITIGVAIPHYQWRVNSTNAGTDSSIFTISTLVNNDTIVCLLINSTGDTVLATSGSMVMTVLPLPDAGTIVGQDTLCVGTTITLSDTVAGGTWSASNNHATIGSNGVVTGISGGIGFESYPPPASDTVMFIVQNSCGADTATKVIAVAPILNPRFTVNPFLCVGWSEYVDFGAGPDVISMYGKVVNMGGPMGESILAVSTGLDYIYNITSNFCGTDTFGRWITILDKPKLPGNIAPIAEVCVGQVAALADSTRSTIYHWTATNNNAAFVADTSGYRIKGMISGFDTIILNCEQCGHQQTTAIFKVKPLPEPPLIFDNICKDHSIPFADSTSAGVWSSGDPSIVSVNLSARTFSGVSSGIALMTYTLPTGCYETEKIEVSACEAEVELFPNPSQGEFIIHRIVAGYSSFVIRNNIGQVLLKDALTGEYSIVHIESWPVGIYYLTVYGDNRNQVFKLMKE